MQELTCFNLIKYFFFTFWVCVTLVASKAIVQTIIKYSRMLGYTLEGMRSCLCILKSMYMYKRGRVFVHVFWHVW